MNIGEQIVTQLLEQSTPIIALYPGKFKPPHAGHFSVVAKAANIADKVIVIMSRGSKDEFTPEDSMKVWDLYKDILPENVEVIVSSNPSPLNDVFDIVKDKTQDYIVLYGKGEESRYNAIKRDREKYSNVDIVDAGNFESLNATDLRNAIRNKDLKNIQKFLPASIDAKKVLDIYSKDEFKPGPILHELKSEYIQNFIKEDIETWGILPEYKIDLNNVYNYKSENGFFTFYDDVNKVDMVVKLKKLPADVIEFKFYPIKEGKVLGFARLENSNPKNMNTIFTIFKDEILPNYNNIILQPAGYTRYRLFRAMINNYLDKNQYEIKLKDDIESPLILISKNIEESAKFNIKKRMETMNESYSQALNYWKNGDIFAQSKSERNSALKKYNSRKQLSEVYNIPFKTNLLLEAFTKDKAPIIKKLVDFACEQLEIDQPQIKLINSPTYSQENSSFGGYMPSEEKILVVVHNRNMADILRTLAHELVHHMQNRRGELDQYSGEDGSPIENEANATAGIIMRKFGRENPQIFEGKINERIIGDKIECDNCGWTWNIKDGGDDLFICHKCGHDNDSSNGLNEIGEANLEPYKWKEDDIAGRYVYTSFITPTETKYEVTLTSTEVPDLKNEDEYIKAISIEFSAKLKDAEGSSSKIVVNKGELYKVMSTIVDIIKYYLRQSNGDIKAIIYSPSKKSNELDFGSQRDNLYKAFITKSIPGAKIKQQDEYTITYLPDNNPLN